MVFKVFLTASAEKDFNKLDGSLKKIVLKKLIQLKNNPFMGQPLGNKTGMDLTGYYKLYVFKKKVRIVYELMEEKLIVSIISIGKREDFSVYFQAYLRINKNKPS